MIEAQQEISENSGFGVSAALSGEHGNTSATSDTEVLKVSRFKTCLQDQKKMNKQISATRFADLLSTIACATVQMQHCGVSGAKNIDSKWLPRGTSLPRTLV